MDLLEDKGKYSGIDTAAPALCTNTAASINVSTSLTKFEIKTDGLIVFVLRSLRFFDAFAVFNLLVE